MFGGDPVRFLCYLTVVGCLGIPATVLAQDVFEGIPVEQRPEMLTDPAESITYALTNVIE